MTKICTKCGETKPLDAFYTQHGKPKASCKTCVRATSRATHSSKDKIITAAKKRAYVSANKETIAAKKRKYAAANQAAIIAYRADAKNKERACALRRDHYANDSEYRARIRLRCSASKKRRQKDPVFRAKCNNWTRARQQKIARATPPWVELKGLEIFYIAAQKASELLGEKHHVDHIVPIKGGNFSGLHVPWNLRVVPASDNLKKSNKLEEFRGLVAPIGWAQTLMGALAARA